MPTDSALLENGATSTVKLSELLGALSYALDLTDGQPVGHCIRTTWIAVAVGKRMGLPDIQLWELYYATLLKDLGCSANAARICELYLADELTIKRGFKAAGTSFPKLLGFVLSNTAPKSPLGERLRTILHLVQNGGKLENEIIQTRCNRGAQIAASLRFPASVSDAIHSLDEHWNGAGHPDGLKGAAIPIYSRVALLAQVVDSVHTSAGREAAVAEARARCGTWFDPHVVECFVAVASEDAFWSTLSGEGVADAVFSLEPGRSLISVDEDYLDDIARAFAQIIDSKSPFTAGHSERVALYSELVAAQIGYTPNRQRWIRRAALLHDIGKLGVSNSILDKNGKLDDEEWVQMRNHASWSETILERVPVFKEMAVVGGAHHERLDGKGYPRGLAGAQIESDTRIVSVADVFDALTADHPYRAAMPVEKALGIMRADVGSSFDPACFEALERAIADMEGELAKVA